MCRASRRLNELLQPGPKKMTQEDIATLIGVEQQTVSQWVNGKHKPKSAEVMARLQSKLGIPVEDWLPDEERRSGKQKRAAGAR